LLILPSLSLPPLECCFGTSPIQAEKLRPERKALGSAMLATRDVASTGPTPGIASSRLLVSCDRCQVTIIRSNSRICSLSLYSSPARFWLTLRPASCWVVLRPRLTRLGLDHWQSIRYRSMLPSVQRPTQQ